MLDAHLFASLPLWLVAFLFSLTCHEAAHAFAAQLGGDDTAARGGQVTLDPLPHIRREPFGTLVIPIVSFLMNGGGWMLGWASAPYDPRWAERFPKRAALMAAAGPMANFVLAVISGVVIRVGLSQHWFMAPDLVGLDQIVVDGTTAKATAVTSFLSVVFSLNVLLGAFNLLPVPPLDGHGVVPFFLNAKMTSRWNDLFRDPSASMIGLVVSFFVFQRISGPVFPLRLACFTPRLTIRGRERALSSKFRGLFRRV